MNNLRLEDFDRDGALREAAAGLPAATRRSFLSSATTGAAGALLVGLVAVGEASAKATDDVSILNFALTLEYLQAAFYTEAERVGALDGVAARAAAQIGAVERAHVAALRAALGSKAVSSPSFDFTGAVSDGPSFLRTAVAFEDLGTAAYKGQLPQISSPAYLAAAAAIHSVEARHAAWIRYLAAREPAANAVDLPLDRGEVERLVTSTGFIVAAPVTTSGRSPSFRG